MGEQQVLLVAHSLCSCYSTIDIGSYFIIMTVEILKVTHTNKNAIFVNVYKDSYFRCTLSYNNL